MKEQENYIFHAKLLIHILEGGGVVVVKGRASLDRAKVNNLW